MFLFNFDVGVNVFLLDFDLDVDVCLFRYDVDFVMFWLISMLMRTCP